MNEEELPKFQSYLFDHTEFGGLRQQYMANLRHVFDQWFSQWFYAKVSAMSDWNDVTDDHNVETVLLGNHDIPLLEVRVLDTTLRAICGHHLFGANYQVARIYMENALKDLLCKLSYCRKNSYLEIMSKRSSNFRPPSLSSAVIFNVATQDGMVETIFHSALYADYLQSLQSNSYNVERINL